MRDYAQVIAPARHRLSGKDAAYPHVSNRFNCSNVFSEVIIGSSKLHCTNYYRILFTLSPHIRWCGWLLRMKYWRQLEWKCTTQHNIHVPRKRRQRRRRNKCWNYYHFTIMLSCMRRLITTCGRGPPGPCRHCIQLFVLPQLSFAHLCDFHWLVLLLLLLYLSRSCCCLCCCCITPHSNLLRIPAVAKPFCCESHTIIIAMDVRCHTCYSQLLDETIESSSNSYTSGGGNISNKASNSRSK